MVYLFAVLMWNPSLMVSNTNSEMMIVLFQRFLHQCWSFPAVHYVHHPVKMMVTKMLHATKLDMMADAITVTMTTAVAQVGHSVEPVDIDVVEILRCKHKLCNSSCILSFLSQEIAPSDYE